MTGRPASGTRRGTRSVLLTVLSALVAVALWWWTTGDGDDAERGSPVSGEVDPVSGLVWVHPDELPPEAGDTLELIDRGGPFPYPDRDGSTFGNFEGLLPDHERGYYREYTVPTPGSPDRGARRLVVGDGDETYWTADHYASFDRVIR